MSWKDKIRKLEAGFRGMDEDEDEDEKRPLIAITKEKLEQIEDELYDLSVKQLEDLFDALDDALNNID